MSDRSDVEAQALLQGCPDLHAKVLDYDLCQQVEGVVAAAVQRHPLAAYTALLLTQVGHSLPEVLERGLPLLRLVLDAGRLDHTIEVLLHLVPVLVADPSSLQHPGLQTIMVKLLAADQTYLSLAKSLLGSPAPGPVTRELACMLERSLGDHTKLGLESSRRLVSFWLAILTSLPQWSSLPSCLHLLDLLCRHSFLQPATHLETLALVRDLHRKHLCDLSSQGLINWITGINYSGLKPLFSSPLPQQPWLAYYLLTSEELHLLECGVWPALLRHLGDGEALEPALVSAAKDVGEVAPPSTLLPLHRWLAQALETSSSHPLLPLLWQGFLRLFLARPQACVSGEEPRGVGMAFFQGMLNTLYYGKVKTVLKGLHELYSQEAEQEELEARSRRESLARLYRALHLWLEEAKVLDSSLYIPALSPSYCPERLAGLLAGETGPWLELLPRHLLLQEAEQGRQEWDRLHFRNCPDSKTRTPYSTSLKASLPASERILERLQSYEPRLPHPPLHPAPYLLPSLPLDGSLLPSLHQPLALLSSLASTHTTTVASYSSLSCSYLELAPSLYQDEEVEAAARVPCPGTTVGKQKLECAGGGLVQLSYQEARLQEAVQYRLEAGRKEWLEQEHRLLAPPLQKFVLAAATVSSAATRLLRTYEKQLRGKVEQESRQQGLELLYLVAEAVGEEWLACPATRHWASELLEQLASILISSSPGQAPRLLTLLSSSPHLSPFLSPHFSPNPEDTAEVLSLYSSLSHLPDGDGALPFVLLSKLDLSSWLATSPPSSATSSLLSTLGSCLARSGPEPPPPRAMLHGLHRRHLLLLLQHSPSHYPDVLRLLLALTEGSTLDPALWLDLLCCLTSSPGRFCLTSQTQQERLGEVASWLVAQGSQGLVLGLEAASIVTHHFQEERLHFGLYGLYPKYRNYVEPLAAYLCLLGGQLIASGPLQEVWPRLEALYGPWLLPLAPQDRGEAAPWIQHLTDSASCLPPWIPGDSASAAALLSSLLSCLQGREEQGSLSLLWRLYCRHWGAPGSKEHVQGVVHPALLLLPWQAWRPALQEVELMVRLMGQFAPASHAFLGALFLRVPWPSMVEELGERLLPALLLLLVKLSGEPTVRQEAALLSLVQEAEAWQWTCVEAQHFESLAQWFVMSVDCRVSVRHPDRSPLDEAVLRLFRAAAGFGREVGEVGAAKQRVWVKCTAKLLTSCGSKQRNFLAHHQPGLHTSLRRLLEDLSSIALLHPLAATPLVRDYLATLNSPATSVLPSSSLTVVQSWLATTPPPATLLHALLNLVGVAVTEPRTSATVLESTLEAVFKDVEGAEPPSWGRALQHLSWPAAPRLKPLLSAGVAQGAALLLHAHIRHRQVGCGSTQEERVLAASLLEWLREVGLQSSGPGLEAKLPLLYRQLVVLLQRQAVHSPDHWVVGAVGQLADLLLQVADSSPGWGQNLLGAMGLGSSTGLSVRGRFLARALHVYLRWAGVIQSYRVQGRGHTVVVICLGKSQYGRQDNIVVLTLISS